MAPTLVQNRRPDWDSRSFRSRFDVTALTLPRFPMRVRSVLRAITPQTGPYYFSEKIFLMLGAL